MSDLVGNHTVGFPTRRLIYINVSVLQFGQVVEAPADFYSSRIPKKQRKSTMVEELLADAEFRR